MKIGFSCSVWASCEREGHLDGIGTYTKAMWSALHDIKEQVCPPLDLKPYAFGRDFVPAPFGTPKTLADSFKYHAIMSGTLRMPLANSAAIGKDVELFHATDHQIPQIQGTPVIATVMDLIPQLHPEWIKQDLRRVKSWLFTRSIRKADHIITISEYSKQDMVNHLGLDPERISVTPLGVEPIYFERIETAQREAVLAKYDIKPGFFLIIGTLQPRKNLPRVLEAFQALPDEFRKAHPLIVVGRNGWNNEELIPQLKALQQASEGKWLSYLPQSEVFALLQSASALVFASLYEGFGLPVIEAFAAQCPVIASNTTSLPEVTADAAWSVDPLDVRSICQAMQDVVNQHELRLEKIEKGLLRARHFSWQDCARKTLAVYEKVLAAKL